MIDLHQTAENLSALITSTRKSRCSNGLFLSCGRVL